MADGFPIADGYIDIRAETEAARRQIRDLLRDIDRRLDEAENNAAESGRRAGHRYGNNLRGALGDGLRGGLIDEIIPPVIGGGGGGGGGGGLISGIIGGITGAVSSIIQEISDLIAEIQSALSGLSSWFQGFLTDIQTAFNDLISNLRSGMTRFITVLQATWTRFLGTLTGSGSRIQSFLASLLTRIRTLWSSFTTWASGALSATWTRIRTLWSGSLVGARTLWLRFSIWALASIRSLGVIMSSIWTRFRLWAMSTLTTIALVAGILFSRMRVWASGVWTRMRSWAFAAWSAIAARSRAMWTRFTGWGRRAWTAISGWFTSLFSTVTTWLGSLGGHLSTLGSQLGSIFGKIQPLLMPALYSSLIPIILALGGAIGNLLPLLFLLPAALATLISIIAPAIVAFKGLGEAIGAGLSGDMDKFNEALKKLTPNARAFVKEFVKLGPILKEIKRRTQNALFAPLLGTIKPLAKTLFPALAAGMEKTAGALGRMLAGFARMLGTPEVISAINALFATSARILDKLGPALANLFGALFGTVEGGLPWIERLTEKLANALNTFANWLRLVKGNGDMQRWLTTAWTTAGKLWEVLRQLGKLIGNLFGDAGDEGDDFLVGLAKSLENINKYLTSTDGKNFLDDLVDTIYVVMVVFDALLWVIKFTINAFLGLKQAGIQVWGWLKEAWAWLLKAFDATVAWFKMAGSVSWAWIKNAASAIGDFFSGVGGWFVDAYNTVVEWGSKIVDWFTKVPGWIGEFFSNLPGWILSGLAALRDGVAYAIGYVAGLIVATFMGLPPLLWAAWVWIVSVVTSGAAKVWEVAKALPGRIWGALSSFGSMLADWAASAWNWAWQKTVSGVDAVWSYVSALPGRIWGSVSKMPGEVGKAVGDTWTTAKDKTSKGVDSVTKTVSELPGKVGRALSGAAHWLWDVGADMMRGLVNGLTSLMGWAVDQAWKIAKKIKDGFLDALDIGSPSRVMQKEVGRWLLPGVVKGVDDTIPETMRYLGATANMMVQGFSPTVNVAAPNVNMGNTVLHADFGDGIAQAVPLHITRNPRIVAAAADVGRRERNGWVNTGRRS